MATADLYTLYVLDEERNNLEVLHSSLDENIESKLREYVERQLKRLLSQSGFVVTTQLSEESASCMCYLSLIDTTEIEGVSKEKFVVCFVDNDIENHLDSFRTELDLYTNQLANTLANYKVEWKVLSTETVNMLESWYSQCVHYINRCVKRFGKDLAILIHAAFLSAKIKINASSESEDNKQLMADVERFLIGGSLSRLIYSDKVIPKVPDDWSSNDIVPELLNDRDINLTVDDVGYKFSEWDVNNACSRWAQSMLKDDTRSSFTMRQILEEMKLKTVQEINLLKRILTQAQSSYYDLYRAHTFLVTCGNGDVLLKHLYSGLLNDYDQGIDDIIKVLYDEYKSSGQST